jgi:hypothetical protein
MLVPSSADALSVMYVLTPLYGHGVLAGCPAATVGSVGLLLNLVGLHVHLQHPLC